MSRHFTSTRWHRAAAAFLQVGAIYCGIVPSLSATPARESDSSAREVASGQWALLIGCEQYHRANKLRYTVNDVKQLAGTLHAWGGYGRDHILEMTDQSNNDRYKPLKTNLQAELPNFLRKIGPDDVLIVYFSGHGFRDADGKMYLAPLDVDPDKPADTGIPVEWFRQQIAGCPAAFKLLVLDACHAGSEKGEDETAGIPSKDLGEQFKDLEKVVTLASSTADQKSQIWDDKQQSLFSYWLKQGLRGHADADGDGNIDIDELYKYVSRTVSHTADSRFSRQQTPVRIVRSGVQDVPVIEHLQPQRLKQVLADMAEQLGDAMTERHVGKLGVLEFTNDTKLGELLGADFGQLGKWCAMELEQQLMDQGAGKFSVVDNRKLQSALGAQGFKITDLGSPAALKSLSKRAGGMPAIVQGILRNRAGQIVSLQCKLCETEGDETLASVGGTAALNESEWAMLGHSASVTAEDYRPEAPTATSPFRPVSTSVIPKLDERGRGPHPMLDPSCPCRVAIKFGGLERKGVF